MELLIVYKMRNQIQKVFSEINSDEKKEILIFLRGCSRSLYIMPSYIPRALQKIPALDPGLFSKVDLPKILECFSKNELALPAFALSEKTRLEDLFSTLHGILSMEYRGPIFFYQTTPLEKIDRQMGILNSTPAQIETLNTKNIDQCVNSLKSLQWFRNRILSLSEPWMYAGIFD
jgi:hypothetical protein